MPNGIKSDPAQSQPLTTSCNRLISVLLSQLPWSKTITRVRQRKSMAAQECRPLASTSTPFSTTFRTHITSGLGFKPSWKRLKTVSWQPSTKQLWNIWRETPKYANSRDYTSQLPLMTIRFPKGTQVRAAEPPSQRGCVYCSLYTPPDFQVSGMDIALASVPWEMKWRGNK